MAGFNFAQAKQEAFQELQNKALGLLVLGQSGSGKSTLAGTFGCKTLYLYTTGESHGAKAARKFGSDNIVPIQLDYAEGRGLTADESYKRLLDILSDVEGIKAEGFGAIVVDGATELEMLIRQTTKWQTLCLTDKGKHNNFAEGSATLVMFRPIIDQLKNLQRQLGLHFMMSCILDVQSIAENGEITDSKPRLQTYSVAEGIIVQFEDIVAVGRMSKGDKISHRIQFLAGVSRQSKDAAGYVKKSINFNPRISGLALEDLPSTLKADLQELIKLKAGK